MDDQAGSDWETAYAKVKAECRDQHLWFEREGRTSPDVRCFAGLRVLLLKRKVVACGTERREMLEFIMDHGVAGGVLIEWIDPAAE